MFYQITCIVQQYKLSSATLYFGPVQKVISIIDYIGWISNNIECNKLLGLYKCY